VNCAPQAPGTSSRRGQDEDTPASRVAGRRRAQGPAFAACAACAWPALAAPPDLADLSLEQLAEIEITSLSRRSEKLSNAAASIHVISAEDIRRAGVVTLAEALRPAPNLQVARVSAARYAIGARALNNTLTNNQGRSDERPAGRTEVSGANPS
jgi:outer membrane receptor for ferrienterochelin and colicin